MIHCLFEDNQRNIWIGSSNGLEIYNLTTQKKNILLTKKTASC
ncbi:MAG: two-component regulator propeller domain-containing protein [Bacteroides cellulosilyticus]